MSKLGGPLSLSYNHIYIVSWVNIFNLDLPENKTRISLATHYLKWRTCIFPGGYFSFISHLGNSGCNSPTCIFMKSALDFPYCWLASTWHANQNPSRWNLTTSRSMVFTRHPRWIQLPWALRKEAPQIGLNNSGFCCRFGPQNFPPSSRKMNHHLEKPMRSEGFDIKNMTFKNSTFPKTNDIQWHHHDIRLVTSCWYFLWRFLLHTSATLTFDCR